MADKVAAQTIPGCAWCAGSTCDEVCRLADVECPNRFPQTALHGVPANIVWVPINEAPDWMKAPGVHLLVWCGQPVCGCYTDDAKDPERREDGLVLDYNWHGMSEPSFIAAINPPKELSRGK